MSGTHFTARLSENYRRAIKKISAAERKTETELLRQWIELAAAEHGILIMEKTHAEKTTGVPVRAGRGA